MKVITSRIPERLFKDLMDIEKDEQADRAEVIRRLLAAGVKHWKIRKAINLLRERKVTLRRAAAVAGITYHEMLDLATEHNITIGYSLKDVEQDLERI